MTSAEGTYQPLNADNLTQFSEAILNSRDAHVQSRYGKLSPIVLAVSPYDSSYAFMCTRGHVHCFTLLPLS